MRPHLWGASFFLLIPRWNCRNHPLQKALYNDGSQMYSGTAYHNNRSESRSSSSSGLMALAFLALHNLLISTLLIVSSEEPKNRNLVGPPRWVYPQPSSVNFPSISLLLHCVHFFKLHEVAEKKDPSSVWFY